MHFVHCCSKALAMVMCAVNEGKAMLVFLGRGLAWYEALIVGVGYAGGTASAAAASSATYSLVYTPPFWAMHLILISPEDIDAGCAHRYADGDDEEGVPRWCIRPVGKDAYVYKTTTLLEDTEVEVAFGFLVSCSVFKRGHSSPFLAAY
jgi:hypothetical protein